MQSTSPWMCRLLYSALVTLGFCGIMDAQMVSPWPSTPGADAPIPMVPTDPTGRSSGAAPVANTPGAPVAAARPNSWPGGAASQPPGDAVLMQRYPEAYGQPATSVSPQGYPPSQTNPSGQIYPVQTPNTIFSRPAMQPPAPTAPPAGLGEFPSAMSGPATENSIRVLPVAVAGPEAILVNDIISELEGRLEKSDKDFETQIKEQYKEQVAASRAEGVDLIEHIREQRRQKFTDDLIGAVGMAAKAKGDPSRLEPYEKQQINMLSELIKATVEAKLIFYDARQGIPAEGFTNAEKQVNKLFDSNESKRLMKKAKVDTWRDLEGWLRNRGSSIDHERRVFLERTISRQWLQQQIKNDEEVTYDQMIAYYHERGTEFDKPARTHWQLISVRFTTYPSKSEAYQAIAEIGNKIVVSGEDFSDYAEPVRNKETGEMDPMREWSPPAPGTRASIMEKGMPAPVEKAVMGLPAGQLSPILDDWSGYYVVKVIDRLPAGRTPFEAAQEEIRDKITRQRFQDQVEKYLKKIRDQIPVWTILEDPRMASVPASPVQGLYGPLSGEPIRR